MSSVKYSLNMSHYRNSTYININLDFVSHGTFASDHYLTASIHLQLLGGHSTRSKDSSNKVELQTATNIHITSSEMLQCTTT